MALRGREPLCLTLRTYGGRRGHGGLGGLRRVQLTSNWFSPQDRKRFFSSSSSGGGGGLEASDSSDEDFQPSRPRKKRPLPPRARRRRGRREEAENEPLGSAGRVVPSRPPPGNRGLPLLSSTPSVAPRSPSSPAGPGSRRGGESGACGAPPARCPSGVRTVLCELSPVPRGGGGPPTLELAPAKGGPPRRATRGPFLAQAGHRTSPRDARRASPLAAPRTAGDAQGGSHSRDTNNSLGRPPRNRCYNLRTSMEPFRPSLSFPTAADASSPEGRAPKPSSSPGAAKKDRSGGFPKEEGGGTTTRKACISGVSSTRWRKARPRRAGPNRKAEQRRPRAPEESSLLHDHLSRKKRQASVPPLPSQDKSFLKNPLGWARTKASHSLHKKKKVTASANGGGGGGSLSVPVCETDVSGCSRVSGYYSFWQASSVTMLTPGSSLAFAELMPTDAEKVYGECRQDGPISFDQCIPPDKMKKCEKIGEGVFGEVFRTVGDNRPVALKIIPIEGTERVNGEVQKTFGEVLPEIIISKELSLLSQGGTNRTEGFIGLHSVHCVKGAYPRHLLRAWDQYDKIKGSENNRPDFFGDQQLFVVLEFEFGGSDLENMKKALSSVATAKSILHQVTASLAVAEAALGFEHRDLHWGNVLVKRTNLKKLQYTLDGKTCAIATHGVHANIIDYTLSRLEKEGLTVFCDISTDEELFQGQGDLQFEVYRKMKEENSNNWAQFHPYSNVLWLHYLADKFLTAVSYKTKPSTSAMKAVQQQLKQFLKTVLNFSSATEVLHGHCLFQ
ncbi:serine/threonine-protein kinase haspin [Tachyglossus aculeatus]|uniref:serine/threonine-protein kinase haspin n=1 Tax=Tachyglossus aculeatus TaxID=9261 RepID=UPI0018F358CE|nr:serine/threonine-protein kinase haspin [Tachyglossus aculeatus]